MFPITVISVENIDLVSTFLCSIFDIKHQNITHVTSPFKYDVIQLIDHTSIMILSKDSTIVGLNKLIQKHICIMVSDIKLVLQKATKLGAVVMASNMDDCMMLGPEKLILHVINIKTIQPIHEILVASLKTEEVNPAETGGDSTHPIKLKRPTPIPTVKVEILTANSQRFGPLLPNSFEPIPFETEVYILTYSPTTFVF
jgi:hypothetical protein